MQNYNSKFKIFGPRFKTFRFERGQALITLIFFTLIAITIASGAIIVIAVNTSSLSKLQEGSISYYSSEAGIENALLRAIRDPNNYTGETLIVDDDSIVITVTGANPKIITAVSSNGNFKRTVRVEMSYNNGYYTISNWREI